jgi:hypothetical protein
MRKIGRIATGVFEARHIHVGAKRCYGSKISKGGFIKVTICLMEPWEGQHNPVPLDALKERND